MPAGMGYGFPSWGGSSGGGGSMGFLESMGAMANPLGSAMGMSPLASLLMSTNFQMSGPGGSFRAGMPPDAIGNMAMAQMLAPMLKKMQREQDNAANSTPTGVVTTPANRIASAGHMMSPLSPLNFLNVR